MAATTALVALGFSGQGRTSPADNKATASNAMIDLFKNQDPTGIDRYFNTTERYTQHNTRIPDGLDALRKIAQAATTWNGVSIEIHHAIADGDMAVLHSVYQNLVNSHQPAVAFDLFRFDKNGKIVEHWDALEPPVQTDPTGLSQVDGATEITDRNKTEFNRNMVKRYVDAVMIKGRVEDKTRFLDAQFIDHHLPVSFIIDMSTGTDPTGAIRRPISDLSYVKLHRTLAEGNFVFAQGEGRLPGDQVVEIYDLFRLKGGRLVEHWDVHQPLAPRDKWANKGPF